jgi:hypothetical protein
LQDNGVADVDLILHQAVEVQLGIRLAANGADDIQTRPHHVIFPQLPHRIVKCGSCHRTSDDGRPTAWCCNRDRCPWASDHCGNDQATGEDVRHS